MAMLIAMIGTILAAGVYYIFGFWAEDEAMMLLIPIVLLIVAQVFHAKAARIGKLIRPAGEKGMEARTAVLISMMMGLVLYLVPTCTAETNTYMDDDFHVLYVLAKLVGAIVIAENVFLFAQLAVQEIQGKKPPVVPSATPQGK